MFRALFIKEWTQLRSLRWVGSGLGLLFPPFLLTVAEASSRGWIPFGSLSGYSVRDLFISAFPGLAVALWGLLALMASSQAFVADRSSGTESFLLERPVRRSRVWTARLLAGLGSITVLVLAHILVYLALIQIVASPTSAEWRVVLLVLAVTALVVPACFVAGVGAAAFVGSPMQAVLLGMVFAAVPPAVAAWLGSLFPLAAIGRVAVGLIIPVLFLPAYGLASFRMSCRGEPAGRGRLRRGALVLGATGLAVLVLFLVSAPLLVRANSPLTSGVLVAPQTPGDSVLVMSDRGLPAAWIVDVETARPTRYLPPPVWSAGWSEDGKRLAVVHSSKPLGGLSSIWRFETFGPDGSRLDISFAVDTSVTWIRELIAFDELWLAPASRGSDNAGVLLLISSIDGTVREIEVPGAAWEWRLIGPTEDGELFVHRLTDPERREYTLHRLDLERGQLDPDPVLVEQGFPTYSTRNLSPSGRFWMRSIDLPGQGMWLQDLDDPENSPRIECSWADWMSEDRVACLQSGSTDSALSVGSPGERFAELLARPGRRITFEVSPDGERLLVLVWSLVAGSEQEEPSGTYAYWSSGRYWKTGPHLDELWVITPATGERRELTDRIPDLQNEGVLHLLWVGSDRLALMGHETLAFLEVEGDGGPRFTFGGS